jgi:hypothetical protein
MTSILNNIDISYVNIEGKYYNNYTFINFIPSIKSVGSEAVNCATTTNEFTTNTTVDMKLIDNNLHTRDSCKLNASILFSDLKFKERQMLDNGLILKKSGLSFKIANGYYADDPSYFLNSSNNLTITESSTNATKFYSIQDSTVGSSLINTINGGNTYSVEWFGYVIPDFTGNWVFGINSDDASYLWLGENAINDYNIANALVKNGGLHGMQYIQNI